MGFTGGHAAILHTTPATIASLKALCDRLLPGVTVHHYLDDSLLPQINREGGISKDVRERFAMLLALADAAHPRVILSACSTVGGLLEELRATTATPLERIDEPMARAAAQRAGRTIVCATLSSTLGPTLELLARKMGEGRAADSLLIEGAGELLARGDQEAYLNCIADALTGAAGGHETVVLAQASMAQAIDRVPEALRPRFLTSPESGVAALQKYFTNRGGAA